MHGFVNNLLRIGATHPHTTSWGGSFVVHVMGAVVATTWFGAIFFESPRLPGQQTLARVELASSWTRPEPPMPAVRIVQPEPKVIVLPDRVYVPPETMYTQSPTDVSEATTDELAMADRLMPAPSEAVSRRVPLSLPRAEKPPAREISRESRSAAVPVVSIPRQESVGTSADTLPEMLDNRPPSYPHRAYVERLEGTVILQILVTAEGKVGSLEISTSSGHPILDAEAMQAIRSWRFAPARRFGRPIPYTVRLPVRFMLN